MVKIGNTGFECTFDPRRTPEDDALQIANLIKTAVEHHDELKEVVEYCAKQFRMYEQQHLVKNTHVGNVKAGTNAAAAERCENVLKSIEVVAPGDINMDVVERVPIEMKAAGFHPNDIDAMHAIVHTFFNKWHKGESAIIMLPILERLLRGLPLTPLTGADDEWIRFAQEDLAVQNRRCSNVLKDSESGNAFDVDNRDWDGTFPYYPKG